MRGGGILEQTRLGVITFRYPMTVIQYHNHRPKRLKLRIKVNVSAIGLNPFASYVCYCGGGINRIAIMVKSPFKQLLNAVNSVLQLQLLLSVIQILANLVHMS